MGTTTALTAILAQIQVGLPETRALDTGKQYGALSQVAWIEPRSHHPLECLEPCLRLETQALLPQQH